MATRMQQRRGTAAQWSSSNPTLGAGEIGWESDTNKFKIGDGTNLWNDLDYFVDQASLNTSLGDYVETSTLGQPNGTATLDSTGNVPFSQLGNIIDGAPGVLNTLNEIASAINDDPTFFTSVATNLSNHESDTTSVHGISDTAELATKTFAAELLTNATKTNITITGDKNGLTITAENGVADSTTDNLSEGSTNLYFTNERAQDAIGLNLGSGLSYNDTTGSISVTTNTYDSYGSASTAQSNAETFATNAINALTTSDIEEGTNLYFTDERAQDAVGLNVGTGLSYNDTTGAISIDSTVATKTYADTAAANAAAALVDSAPATLDTLNELAAALGDDPNYATTITTALGTKQDKVTGISDTEIGYLDGVTSAIQTQIDGKISASSSDILTNKTISGSNNTISNIGNSSLTNSSITINGSAVSLGGSVTIDALPSQSGNDGKYLSTNGTSASWTSLPYTPMPANSTNSNISVVSNNRYFVDTSSARTLTLPASPSLGDEIQVFDQTGSAATNNITINSNGNKINGTVQNLLVDINYDMTTLTYTGSNYGWKVS